MQLNMNLEGIILKLGIAGYDLYKKNWCKVDFSLTSDSWLNYHREGTEILSSNEIRWIMKSIEKLLNDEIVEEKHLVFSEPDFEFVLSPRFDVRNNPNMVYVKPGHEIIDISIEWRIFFWDEGGLTANHISLYLDRANIQDLWNYLMLVTEETREEIL